MPLTVPTYARSLDSIIRAEPYVAYSIVLPVPTLITSGCPRTYQSALEATATVPTDVENARSSVPTTTTVSRPPTRKALCIRMPPGAVGSTTQIDRASRLTTGATGVGAGS